MRQHSGYHWCEHCDENAFAAETCPTCRRPTKFIATDRSRVSELPESPRTVSPKPPGPLAPPKIPASEWFRRMHEALANPES